MEDTEAKAMERARVIFGHLNNDEIGHSLDASATVPTTPAKSGKQKGTWLDTLQMNPKMYWPKKYRYTIEPQPGSSPVLNVKERDHYEENGFIVVRNLIPKAAVLRFKQTLDQHTLDAEQLEGTLADFSKLQQLLRYVTCFCGSNVMAMQRSWTRHESLDAGHFGAAGELFLHQDLFSLPFRPADRIVCTWTPLDETEAASFAAVAGTHRSSLLQTIYSADEDGISDDKVIYEPAPHPALLAGERKEMTLKAGDTVFYHPLLVHAFKSTPTQPLRAVSCHFAASECEYVTMSGNEAFIPRHLATSDVHPPEVAWKSRGTLVKGKRITL